MEEFNVKQKAETREKRQFGLDKWVAFLVMRGC